MSADPYRAVDDDARKLIEHILATADHASLGVLSPDTGHPVVTRIAFARLQGGALMTLISTLSDHTRALAANPACSLLLGTPGAPKGDPLTHPRLTLQALARPLPRPGEAYERARAAYLAARPKSKLYIDFADFSLVAFEVTAGFLNAGFGKAYRLTPQDLSAQDHAGQDDWGR